MCLLSLTNPNKKCSHSQCYPQNSNQFPSFSHLNQQGMPIFSYQNKKRPPIQSISETLAENLIKKLKDDKASTRATLEVDKEKGNTFFPETQISPEAFYFQKQVLLLMNQQMQIISDTASGMDQTLNQMKNLRNEMSKTKEFFFENQKKNRLALNKLPAKQKAEKTVVSPNLFIPKPGKIITKDQLLTQLYGQNKEFKYQLKLDSKLESVFYRERNFHFSVALYDNQNNKICNCNKIPLALALYTSENMPKIIETNTIGLPILKGSIEKELIGGLAEFEKLQIKEVTSHFRNGWIFFIIYAKMPSVFSKNSKSNEKNFAGVEIDFMDVKPLLLENVMVKAKKMKSKNMKELETVEHESDAKSESNLDDLVMSEKN